MNPLARFNAHLERVLGIVLAALVALLVAILLWQVLTRFIARIAVAFDRVPWVEPARASEELATATLAWLALLGAAYALRRGEHIGLDVLYRRLSPRMLGIADRVVTAAVLGFSATLVLGGVWLTDMTFALGQRLPALGWPTAWIHLAVPVAGVLLIAFAAERVFSDSSGTGLS